MSDEEYEYDYGSDAGYDYGSDTAMEEDNVQDEAIEIENAFYEGDDYKTENPKKAIEMFEKVVAMETARGEEVKWYVSILNILKLSTHTYFHFLKYF
jgi:COP9 signalosome complex subunit 2